MRMQIDLCMYIDTYTICTHKKLFSLIMQKKMQNLILTRQKKGWPLISYSYVAPAI